MMVKKPKNTTATKRKTVYELVGETRSPLKRGQDPLDDILLNEEQELSREVKRVRLEQIVIRRRQELERMKQGNDLDMGSMPSNADFMKMARLMGDLDPEEQKKVANAYAVLKMADRGQMGGSLGVLGQLMGYVRQNPGASENQMINYLKLMDSQFSKGLELAKAINPAQSEDSTLKFMALMKDLVIAGVRDPVVQAIKESQPQQGVFEMLLSNPSMYTRAKEIGMFGGGNQAASNEMDLKIEELRGERELSGRKLDLEYRKMSLEREANDRRDNMILGALGPLATVLSGPIAEGMHALGQKQGAAHRPPGFINQIDTPPSVNAIRIICACGYTGVEPLTDPPQAEIPCPKCGKTLTVNLPESPSMEENR